MFKFTEVTKVKFNLALSEKTSILCLTLRCSCLAWYAKLPYSFVYMCMPEFTHTPSSTLLGCLQTSFRDVDWCRAIMGESRVCSEIASDTQELTIYIHHIPSRQWIYAFSAVIDAIFRLYALKNLLKSRSPAPTSSSWSIGVSVIACLK